MRMAKAYRPGVICLMLFVLVIACAASSAYADGILHLPSGTKEIEAEAFMATDALTRVVLPEGIEKIGARAFAQSPVSAINLPVSLTDIDKTAFEGAREVTATVAYGSYAHEFCADNGVCYVYRPEDSRYLEPPVLTGFSNGRTTVHLDWTRAEGAAGYMVYMGLSADMSDAKRYMNVSDADVFCRTFGGFTEGKNYYFAISAYVFGNNSEMLESARSGAVSVIPVKIPTAEITDVTYIDADQSLIEWTACEGVTGYEVCRSEHGAFIRDYVTYYVDDPSVTQYLDSSLIANETYYYRVRAYKGGASCSPYMGESSSIWTYDHKPDNPLPDETCEIISIETVAGCRPKIRLSAVENAEEYRLTRRAIKDGAVLNEKTIVVDKDTLLYIDKDVVGGVIYLYTPYACAYGTKTGILYETDAGTGLEYLCEFSDIEVPEILNASFAARGQAQIEWTRVEGVDGYMVIRSTDPDFAENTEDFILWQDESRFTDTGLQDQQTYYYSVAAAIISDQVMYAGSFSEAYQFEFVDFSVIRASFVTEDVYGNQTVYDRNHPIDAYVGSRYVFTLAIDVNGAENVDYQLYSDYCSVQTYIDADGYAHVDVLSDEKANIYISAYEASSFEDVPEDQLFLVCAVNMPVYRALIIGNDYKGNTADISVLECCEADRNAMNSMLSGMGSTNYDVTVAGNLTASEILSEIRSTFSEAKPTDVSLFYYSGHGFSENGSFVGVDRSALSVSVLKDELDQIPGRKIVIIDSCYSGNFIGKSATYALSPVGSENEYIISVFAPKAKSGNLAEAPYYVMTASSKDEQSYGSYISLFTSGITTGSQGDAMPADTNQDDRISLEECYTYAGAYVLESYPDLEQHAQVYPLNCSFVIWAK